MATTTEDSMDVPEEMTLHWAEEVGNVVHEEVCGLEEVVEEEDIVAQDEEEVIGACEEVVEEEIVEEEILEQPVEQDSGDAEILMVPQSSDMESIYIVPQDQGHDYFNIQVTEEVVADNWDRSGPDDGVEIPETKVSHDNLLEYDDMEIPLPIDQDSYTNTRPYPCDFCSRRFRKKANLMNHMVAHQTDRPHGCNLCGARYVRKCDLMNHLKIHAYAPSRDGLEDDLNDEDPLLPEEEGGGGGGGGTTKGRRKKVQSSAPRRRKNNAAAAAAAAAAKRNQEEAKVDVGKLVSKSYNYVDEDMRLLEVMTSSRGGGGGGSSSSSRGNNNLASSSSRWTDQMTMVNDELAGGGQESDSPPPAPRWPITDPTKPYVCQFCGVGFAREKALASHSRIHGGDSPFECTVCGEMYWDVKSLREHMRAKHGAVAAAALAMETETDEMGSSMGTAEASYTGDERFGDFFCETCGAAFHRMDQLKRHRKIHVKQEVEMIEGGSSQHHVCNVCGEWFEEALALLAHAELHARSPSRRCLLCGEVCRDDAEVAEHVRQNHADDAPPNTCHQCGKTCKDKRSLLKHSWVHNVDKTFSCTKCGKRFHSKARLRRHMVSHRNKMVACDECGEEFPDGRALVSHRHSHNKDLGGRSFPCRECGKTFGSRSSQQIHIRIHTGERPYSCRFCWKAFADGGTLRKHERIHTGEKPYGCTICPRAFNQRVVLREHVRAHHSGPDPKCHGSMTPYLCKVCGESYATSDEIVAHIVQHCDDNTAQRRQPQTGPRKYKRRRKIKAHDSVPAPRISESYDMLDGASESDDNTKRKLGRKSKARTEVQEGYQNVLKSFESSLQNINSIVSNAKVSNPSKAKLTKKKMKREEKKVEPALTAPLGRSKMIHTQKTRVPVEVGSEGVKKGQKTKTMITRTPKVMTNEHKLGIFPGGERNRPRTKNVSYHIETKNQVAPATFPRSKEDEILPDLLQEDKQQTEESEELETSIEDVPISEMINVKMEPGLIKSQQHHANNNGSIGGGGGGGEDGKLTTPKRKLAPRRGRRTRQQVVIKQEPREEIVDIPSAEIEETVETGPLTEQHHLVDGNTMEVAFEANVVSTEESILPDLDKTCSHSEDVVDKENVKVNVKVESTPQRVVAAHNLIPPHEDTTETIIPDSLESLEHTCEMCSAVFPSHAELLVHVPIHI